MPTFKERLYDGSGCWPMMTTQGQAKVEFVRGWETRESWFHFIRRKLSNRYGWKWEEQGNRRPGESTKEWRDRWNRGGR